jgi:hypothetical protein
MREELVGACEPWIWTRSYFISVSYHQGAFSHNFLEGFHDIFIYSPSCAKFLKEGAFSLGDIEWEISDLLLKTKDLLSCVHILQIYRIAIIIVKFGCQNIRSKFLGCALAREGITLLSYSSD